MYGGTGGDTLNGNGGNDHMYGDAGNDSMTGGEGNDIMVGGEGGDTMSGGLGNDQMFGDQIIRTATGDLNESALRTTLEGDADDMTGGIGNDTMYGGGGKDSMSGGTGNDHMYGGTGGDTLNGNDGNDHMYGDAGNDSMTGGQGNDIMVGGEGGDTMSGGLGNDQMFGDQIIRTKSGKLNTSALRTTLEGDADDMTGGIGNDTMYGGGGKDSMSGGTGNDHMYGGTGGDTLNGNDGNDHMYGDAGNDSMTGGQGNDIMVGGEGGDTMSGGLGNDQMFGDKIIRTKSGELNTSALRTTLEGDADDMTGGIGNDTMYGGGGKDTMSGGTGDDHIYGGTGGDTLNGNDGNDHMYGDAGNDSMTGGQGNDIMVGGEGGDTMSGGLGNDQMFGDQIIRTATGDLNESALRTTLEGDADDMTGGIGNDTMYGGGGKDSMSGGTGNDHMYGGTGGDTLNGNDGNDHMYGDAGNDSMTGGQGNDIMVGGEGGDTMSGGLGNDQMFGDQIIRTKSGKLNTSALRTTLEGDADDMTGGIGNDTMYGGGGKDSMSGGTGNDHMYGGTGGDTLNGNDGNDHMYGDAGNDSMTGGQGNDIMVGGEGGDTMSGGLGNDQMFGDQIIRTKSGKLNTSALRTTLEGDADDMTGGIGNDTMYGGGGKDSMSGGTGNDHMYGGTGGDTLNGNDGNDHMYGDAGNDSMTGGQGNDIMVGGEGGDTMSGGLGNDQMFGDQIIRTKSGKLNTSALRTTLEGDADDMTGGIGNDTMYGGGGKDTMSGGTGNDHMYGGTGGDTLNGNDGNDHMYGDAGNDSMTGGQGNDIMVGGEGGDTMSGGLGNDQMFGDQIIRTATGDLNESALRTTLEGDADDMTGGIGNDTMYGGGGKDTMSGGTGDDHMYGGTGGDTLNGNGGNDHMYGDAGNDSMTGGEGNDIMVGGEGGDTMSGGLGNDQMFGDQIIRTATGDLNESALRTTLEGDADDMTGGIGNDTMYGGGGKDSMSGGTGNDHMYGGTGGDTLNGNDGNDHMYGDAGNDSMTGGQGNDIMVGGEGGDTMSGGLGNDQMFGDQIIRTKSGKLNTSALRTTLEGDADDMTGGIGNDTMYGGGGKDSMSGGTGNDHMYGGTGGDTLNGNDGNDHMYGDAGNDSMTGGQGNDIMVGGEGGDTMSGGLGNDQMFGDQIIRTATGDLNESALRTTLEGDADDMTGGIGNDTMYGGGGDDTMNGGIGSDTMFGGRGEDSMSGGRGADTMYGDRGADTMSGDAGNDKMFGGADGDTMRGGEGNDVIYGEAGDDYLYGDNTAKGTDDGGQIDGADIIHGGTGNDHLYGGGDTNQTRFSIDGGIESTNLINDGSFEDLGSDVKGKTWRPINLEDAGSDWTGGKYDPNSGGNAKTPDENGDPYTEVWTDGYRNVDAAHGRTHVEIDYARGDDFVAQSVSVEAGQTYVLNFKAANRHNSTGEVLTVTIGGKEYQATPSGYASNGWQNYVLTFTASADMTSVDIRFGEQTINNGSNSGLPNQNTSVGIFLDDVGMYKVDDQLFGEDGDDILDGGRGADLLDGGADNDTITYENSEEGVEVHLSSSSLVHSATDDNGNVTTETSSDGIGFGGDAEGDVIRDVENVIGSDQDDKIFGDQNDNRLEGGDGNDVISGGGGSDTLIGGSGADVLKGGFGADILYGDAESEGAVADTPLSTPLTTALHVNGSPHSLDLSEPLVTGNNYVLTFKAYADSGASGETLIVTIGGHEYELKPAFDISGEGVQYTYVFTATEASSTLDFSQLTDEVQDILGIHVEDIGLTPVNDMLEGGVGNDTIYGGDGYDVAVFKGNIDEYEITSRDDNGRHFIEVKHLDSGEIDTVYDVESLKFDDVAIQSDSVGQDNTPHSMTFDTEPSYTPSQAPGIDFNTTEGIDTELKDSDGTPVLDVAVDVGTTLNGGTVLGSVNANSGDAWDSIDSYHITKVVDLSTGADVTGNGLFILNGNELKNVNEMSFTGANAPHYAVTVEAKDTDGGTTEGVINIGQDASDYTEYVLTFKGEDAGWTNSLVVAVTYPNGDTHIIAPGVEDWQDNWLISDWSDSKGVDVDSTLQFTARADATVEYFLIPNVAGKNIASMNYENGTLKYTDENGTLFDDVVVTVLEPGESNLDPTSTSSTDSYRFEDSTDGDYDDFVFSVRTQEADFTLEGTTHEDVLHGTVLDDELLGDPELNQLQSSTLIEDGTFSTFSGVNSGGDNGHENRGLELSGWKTNTSIEVWHDGNEGNRNYFVELDSSSPNGSEPDLRESDMSCDIKTTVGQQYTLSFKAAARESGEQIYVEIDGVKYELSPTDAIFTNSNSASSNNAQFDPDGWDTYSITFTADDTSTQITFGQYQSQNTGENHVGVFVDDIVLTGDSDDELYGYDGDDVLKGMIGDDLLDGGNDSDLLDGGAGNDHLEGGEGTDKLFGGTGNDLLDGGSDVDILIGDAKMNKGSGDVGANVVYSEEDGAAHHIVDNPVTVTPTGVDAGQMHVLTFQAHAENGASSEMLYVIIEGTEYELKPVYHSAGEGGGTPNFLTYKLIFNSTEPNPEIIFNQKDGQAGDGLGIEVHDIAITEVNDILIGGDGNDVLYGGRGYDVAVYDGEFKDYTVSEHIDSDGHTYYNVAKGNVVDTVYDVEALQFSDITLAPADVANNNAPHSMTFETENNFFTAEGIGNPAFATSDNTEGISVHGNHADAVIKAGTYDLPEDAPEGVPGILVGTLGANSGDSWDSIGGYNLTTSDDRFVVTDGKVYIVDGAKFDSGEPVQIDIQYEGSFGGVTNSNTETLTFDVVQMDEVTVTVNDINPNAGYDNVLIYIVDGEPHVAWEGSKSVEYHHTDGHSGTGESVQFYVPHGSDPNFLLLSNMGSEIHDHTVFRYDSGTLQYSNNNGDSWSSVALENIKSQSGSDQHGNLEFEDGGGSPVDFGVHVEVTQEATDHVLDGTQYDDRLVGEDTRDILNGNAGNDILHGYAGDDILFGGSNGVHNLIHDGDFNHLATLPHDGLGIDRFTEHSKWDAKGGAIDIHDSNGSNPYAEVDNCGDGTWLKQEIDTEGGKTYTLKFDAWNDSGSDGIHVKITADDGRILYDADFNKDAVKGGMETVTFDAVDGHSTIEFSQHDGLKGTLSENGIYLDKVSVIEVGGDHLFGGDGHDILNGGAGDFDVLNGGGDEDTFLFTGEDFAISGQTTFIQDFEKGDDHLEFSDVISGDGSENIILSGFDHSGGDTTITVTATQDDSSSSSHTIVLEGVQVGTEGMYVTIGDDSANADQLAVIQQLINSGS